MDANPQLPAVVSVPRITTLLASLLVALSSGTNYVYSAYAPQLGARLHMTHTQLNLVALAGNVGVYSSGPIWGRIVDARGPRILLASAFIFLLSGYAGIRYMYDQGLPDGTSTVSFAEFCMLVACSCMTGFGGNGGLAGSLNATAKTFPDKARASTAGIVLSGFGLSAFFFSTISHIFYADNTSAFLLLLSLGTSIPMIMGYFFVRPIPLPPSAPRPSSIDEHDTSRTSLLNNYETGDSCDHDGERYSSLSENSDNESGVELRGSPDLTNQSSHRSRARELDPNIHGTRLWTNGDFWLLSSILSLLSGTGLMYINNVGAMSQALFAKSNPDYDPVRAAKWQAGQVSSISLLNFAGRIFIGLVSDYAKNTLALPRSYCLVLVSFFFLISQVAAASIDEIKDLWISSALLGLAHGSVFSLFPVLCIEWFGIGHFSENWGYMSLSPIVAGNVFSMIFGRNLDAHEAQSPADPDAPVLPIATGPQCLQGRQCYVDTLYITIAATFLSILLSMWAGWRDRQRRNRSTRKMLQTRSQVLWEEEH